MTLGDNVLGAKLAKKCIPPKHQLSDAPRAKWTTQCGWKWGAAGSGRRAMACVHARARSFSFVMDVSRASKAGKGWWHCLGECLRAENWHAMRAGLGLGLCDCLGRERSWCRRVVAKPLCEVLGRLSEVCCDATVHQLMRENRFDCLMSLVDVIATKSRNAHRAEGWGRRSNVT